jgi:hypothetical protein
MASSNPKLYTVSRRKGEPKVYTTVRGKGMHEVKVSAKPNKGPNRKSRQVSSILSKSQKHVIMAHANMVASSSRKIERKQIIQEFKGTEAPTSLEPPFTPYAFQPTPESKMVTDSFRSMFRNKHYRFELGTALAMAATGAGAVNSTIACATIGALGEFTSLAGVFSEFFIEAIHVRWEPASRYNGPIGFLPATNASSLPLGVVSLQNAQPAYTVLTSAVNNDHFSYQNTNVPFSYSWVNDVPVSSDVVAAPVTSGVSTQTWCPVLNYASYTGSIQFISSAVPPAMPVSSLLGTFATKYVACFRNRD